MQVAQAEGRFRSYSIAAGLHVERADVAQLIAAMLGWYRAERVEDVDGDADGDMILFQWGTYDWGDGPSFQYDITRQLIDVNDLDDDRAIWQLSVTAHFPETLGGAVERGSRWCHSPDGLDDFQAFIDGCDATLAVEGRQPAHVEVRFEQAG